MGQVLPLFVECPQVTAKKATCSECGSLFYPKNFKQKACCIDCSMERKHRKLREYRAKRADQVKLASQRVAENKKRQERQDIWDILVFYENGNSLVQTSLKFKITKPALKRILSEHGIGIRASEFYNKAKDNATEKIKKLAVEDYISTNISAEGVAKKFNLSRKKAKQLTLGVKKMVGIKSGYKSVLDPEHPRSDSSGKVLEHIIVAETKLQRPVLKDEQIHHIDFNKHNNNPENLAVGSPKSHGFWHKTHAEFMTILMPIMLEIGIVSFSEDSGYDMDSLQLKRLERLLKKGEA